MADAHRTLAFPADASADVRLGLIGKGIQASRTPAMHVAEGAAQGLAVRYDLIDPDAMEGAEPGLGAMLDAAEAAGFAGLNITFPYKRAAMSLVDEVSAPARAVGAVNTIVFAGGSRLGDNTDHWGFAESLRRGLPDVDLSAVLLLGAGGAGGAVAHALKALGAETLLIHDIDRTSAAARAAEVGGQVIDDLAAAAATARGIVNATPMGMAKMPGAAIPLALLERRHWVVDIVYFPIETDLLRAARARGCRVLNGEGMAIFQAVRAFELFTGRSADPARMQATFAAFDAMAQSGAADGA